MSASLEVLSDPQASRLDRATWIAFVLVFVLTVAALLAVIVLSLPWPIVLVFPLLFALGLVLRSPVIGFFGLFAAALLIPIIPLGYSDSLTDNIPFFLNLSDVGSLNVSGLGITPAEILMVVVFTGLIAAWAVKRQSRPAGRLMIPYLIFGFAVLIGEINGLVHGGDFKLSLWELRPQAYGLAMFVMATLLIQERSQLKILLAIMLVAEAYKGSVGVFRYFVTIGQEVAATLSNVQPHEESYLLGLFLIAVVIGLIWFHGRLLVLLVAVSPMVFVAIVVNHRRAGMLSLGIEIVTVMVLAYILEPRYRRQLLVAGVMIAVLGAAFTIIFWNQQYGAVAEIIRPIKSLVDPTARDLSSDQYRIAETANLKATFRTSPLLGIGFGHPYYIFYPQNGVAAFDPLWNIIPHNSVLWIPMRMGAVGMISFWCLISIAIIQAVRTIRTVRDKFIRATVLLALAAIFGLLFTGYVDVGLENYRNLIVLGVLLALINRAPYLAREAPVPDENQHTLNKSLLVGQVKQTVEAGAPQ
jgi:hypothetical protein